MFYLNQAISGLLPKTSQPNSLQDISPVIRSLIRLVL